jgi:hypothetical protein
MPALGMAGEVIGFRRDQRTAYAGAPMNVTVRFLPEGREVRVPRG